MWPVAEGDKILNCDYNFNHLLCAKANGVSLFGLKHVLILNTIMINLLKEPISPDYLISSFY